MDEHTTAQVRHLLESLEIDGAKAVNVRPWFPTAEGKVTFRVATEAREVHYLSLPKDFSLREVDPS